MHYATVHQLESAIDAYFVHITGDFYLEDLPAESGYPEQVVQQKGCSRQPEPPTMSGMLLFLGFESQAAFDAKEIKGKFSSCLQRARLRIIYEYEKKLHQHFHGGAIFALKNLGWDTKAQARAKATVPKNLMITVAKSGPPLAGNERDVVMEGNAETVLTDEQKTDLIADPEPLIIETAKPATSVLPLGGKTVTPPVRKKVNTQRRRSGNPHHPLYWAFDGLPP